MVKDTTIVAGSRRIMAFLSAFLTDHAALADVPNIARQSKDPKHWGRKLTPGETSGRRAYLGFCIGVTS